MKKLSLLLGIATLTTSCATMTRNMLGVGEKDLIKIVSVEQNCPKENIKILQKETSFSQALYRLDACGKEVVYKLNDKTTTYDQVKDFK